MVIIMVNICMKIKTYDSQYTLIKFSNNHEDGFNCTRETRKNIGNNYGYL